MKIRPDGVLPVKILQAQTQTQPSNGQAFAELLAGKVAEVDQSLKIADQQSAELLVGRGSIHETMIALEDAGIQLRLAGTVRDKVVTAYQDLTRMQI
jgi:flagellar hook-basal body complex protein FliE